MTPKSKDTPGRFSPPRLIAAACAIAAVALASGAGAPQARTPMDPQGKIVLPALSYTVLKAGPADGAHPMRRDAVTVNYDVHLLDGTEVDSSYARGRPRPSRSQSSFPPGR